MCVNYCSPCVTTPKTGILFLISSVHRLFAIKSPKSVNIVSNMKAVFHYMYDMRMSDDKPDIPVGNMAKKQVRTGRLGLEGG